MEQPRQNLTSMISNIDFIRHLVEIKSKMPTITTNKRITFYNVASAFDIETSSFYELEEKRAIMYEWTFGIGEAVTYGRTWDEFKTLMSAVTLILGLSENKRLVVYVHNLPYEFQFIRKHFNWINVFLLDDLKPVYAITDTGIEFRCSLKLSGKSLANTAKDLVTNKLHKMVGDLDYSKLRTPFTPLTEKELRYCEYDVRVVIAYIEEKIAQDGNITKIPLTNTGYVRGYCRDACFPEMGEDECDDEETDIRPVGVSRTERCVSRRLYPRQCPPRGEEIKESWVIRFYQLLSERYGCRRISDGERDLLWDFINSRNPHALYRLLLYVPNSFSELDFNNFD